MAGSGTPEEQDTTQEDSSASPTTPRQTRPSGAGLAQSVHPRSSSPAKRPAASLEEDHGVKGKEAMDIDGPPSSQKSFSDTVATAGIGSEKVNAVNTSDMNCRAVSVDMLGETQSDSQATSTTGLEAASISRQDVSTAASSYGSTAHDVTDQQPKTLHVDAVEVRTTPSLDEQVIRIHQMYNQFEEKEGVKGYVLSGAWYRRVVAKTTEGQKSGEYTKADMEAEIGPVDNTDLIVQAAVTQRDIKDERGEKYVPLKPGLLQGQNLEIIPEDAWQQIMRWHGLASNSPVIVRYMHDTAPQGSTSHNFMFELYPPIFTVRKVGDDTQSFAGLREPARDAPSLVASRNELVQAFLARVKTAVGVEMKTKVRVWRQMEPITADTVEVSQGQAGMLTPASSRNPSPVPGASTSTAFAPQLIVDPATFSNMAEGSEREIVEIQDQTMNEKYNGHVQLETVGLGISQTLVIEQQVGGPGGGEFVSDTSRNKNKKNGVITKTKTTNTLLNSRAKGTESGRTSPAPSGPVTRGRTRRSGRTRGTIGLVNLGNTCYMNSALQCVRSIEELSMYFLAEKWKTELNVDNPLGHRGEIAKTYSAFVHSIFGESAGAFTPRTLKSTIGRCQPLFSGYGQQDSQEFLSFLLDAIHEDLNRIHKKPYMENPESDDKTVNDPEAIKALGEKFRHNHHARNDSVAMDLFSGFYKNTMVCPECDKVSITFDPYSLLTLQLPIQSSWQHTVIFAPLRGKLVKIQVDVDKHSTIKTLKEYVARKIPGFDPKKCVVAETYNRKFFKTFDDDRAAVESIQSNDIIIVYELDDVPTNFPPPESKSKKSYLSYSYNSPSSDDEISEDSPLAERMLVPVFHRLPSANSSRLSSKSTCQWPSFVLVTREEASHYDEILRKVLAKVATMTTRPILTEDDDGFGLASASNSGSEAILTTDEDASSTNGRKVKDQSVASEDGMVDVSMTENAATQNGAAEDVDTVMNGAESQTNSLPPVLQPGTFIPSHLQALFDMKYFRSGTDIVPTGWNSLTESKDYPTVLSRIPERPVRRSSIQSRTSARSNLDNDSNSSSSEDIDNPPPTVGNNPSFSNDPGSDSEDLPSDRTMLNNRRMRAPNKRASKMKTYGNKGKRAQYPAGSFDGTVETKATDGMLIKPHEGIVLDWNPDAYDGLFAGSMDDDLRGSSAYELMETLPDPELDTKRAKRAARKKHGVTLEECFAETARSEILSEENAWYCNRCKELRLASKTLEIWTVPDILVLHLKRFSAHRGLRDKVDALVDFPIEGLDLSGRVGLPEDKGLVYDLFAVDNHYGGLGGGHYTAYAQNFYDKKWYEYNDSVVSQCGDPQSVVTPYAYLLFYRRRSSTPLGGPFLRDLVLSIRDAESTDDPNHPDSTSPSAGDDPRLGSAGHDGAGAEKGVGPLLRIRNSPKSGAGRPGGATGSPPSGDGETVGAGAGALVTTTTTTGRNARYELEEEDEGVKMADDDDDDAHRNNGDQPAFGPMLPGSFNSSPPVWDFSNLPHEQRVGATVTAATQDDDGIADVEGNDDDGAASDRVAAGSELGEELNNRMLEDFGDDEEGPHHPGFGTPVQRSGDLDEEMIDMPVLAGEIMTVRAPSEEEEEAPVAEVKLDDEE